MNSDDRSAWEVFPASPVERVLPVRRAPRPWRTMWFSPRHTMRRLRDADARPSWMPVIALSAVHSGLTLLSGLYPFTTTADVLGDLLGVVGGVTVSLLLALFVAPSLLTLVGRWLGGIATVSAVRDAVIWSQIPVAATVVCWALVLAFSGLETFNPTLASAEGSGLHLIMLRLVPSLARLWAGVISIGAVAEVQGFSLTRSLICSLIVGIPLLVLGRLLDIALSS